MFAASRLFGEGEGGGLEGGVEGGVADLEEVSAPFVTSERAMHDCALKDVFANREPETADRNNWLITFF